MQNKEIKKKLKQVATKTKKLSCLRFLPDLTSKYPQAGIYAVGGYVRDAIMGTKAKDVDLVINRIDFSDLVDILLQHGKVIFDLDPKAELRKLNPKKRQELLARGFGVIKFIAEGETTSIDIALPRVDVHNKSEIHVDGIKRDVLAQADPTMSIEDDLGRRDFTVNSIALDLKTGEMIDPYNGVSDIKNETLRAIGDPEQRILKEDLSRAFRGLRFSVQLEFDIEDATRNAIEKAFQQTISDVLEVYEKEEKDILDKLISKEKQIRDGFRVPIENNLPRVLQIFYDRQAESAKTAVAVEIITKELLKSFDCDVLETLRIWEAYGALKIILPEIVAMKGTPQPAEYHSEGDVYDHTALALKFIAEQKEDVGLKLKLAVLFHDIGKVETIKFDSKDSNGISFHNHNTVGAEMVSDIFGRLNFPKQISRSVAWVVKNHMLAINGLHNDIKESTVEKYFFVDEESGELLLSLIKYDGMASIPEGHKKSKMEAYKYIAKRVNNLSKLKNELNALPAPLIDGNDLIDLGIKAGPKFSKILDDVRNLQLKGKIKNKEEAIKTIKNKHYKD